MKVYIKLKTWVMAMAVLPAHPSTSTSSSSCVMAYSDSHLTYASDLHSAPNEKLWNDIDLAERFQKTLFVLWKNLREKVG